MYRKILSWTLLVLGSLLLLLSMIGIGAIWIYRVPTTNRALAELQEIDTELTQAQSALDALQAGGDLKNTIIKCYYQMCAVINEHRGILRSQTMTPHEFEDYLASKGLPGEPVHQLTHLFEDVRYGNLLAGAAEEQVALNSLTAIIEACGRTG